MSVHDLYVISPYLAMAGAAVLIILLDLALPKKALLPYLALAALTAPFVMSLIQFYDLGASANLLKGAGEFSTEDPSILLSALSVDRFALFFNFLIIGCVALVVLASTDYVQSVERFQGEYFGLILFAATGMMLLAAATELITIYVSLELTTLPLAALTAFLLNKNSSEAGMKFLIIGAISSALMLYGMALVFGFTGSTQLAEISAAVGQATGDTPFGNYALFVGIILMIAGFGFKLSAAPFQMWVPDVYEGGPVPVVGFLSVASKAAAFAVVLRVFFTGFFDVALDWGILIAGLAAASMVIGNLVAVVQSNIRRLFGYSAIAHAGYILVGVAAGVKSGDGIFKAPEFAAIGPDSVLFYLAAYAAANLTAFFAITMINSKINSDQISDYAGLSSRNPVLAIVLALSLLALIGVPPTGIFIAKLYIFTAAVDSGLVWLAIIGVINSAVSAYYYVRIIRIMFTQPATSEVKITGSPAPWLALGLAGAAMLFMGIAPGFVMEAAQEAVKALAV
ncbi:MAG: NADH-quinone oxidoreductase subunit N [Chloroflexota bacterium]|nr:NADH-quinone oxidoreductase subunit N [Chloroflexota bacterium]|tara:strand:+ start:141 stop:1670 length:1530 start_codon:yes stop_codon:yes gene_type:complete